MFVVIAVLIHSMIIVGIPNSILIASIVIAIVIDKFGSSCCCCCRLTAVTVRDQLSPAEGP